MPACFRKPSALLRAALPAVAAWALLAGPALGQPSSVQTCQLGDLALESGEVIRNFRMTYITFGTLNEQKSNAILSLHGLQGNRNSQTYWVGPGKAFDPKRYFIIQPDTLGVASIDPNATTSPTRSGLNMSFPRFNIRDMVNAEHRMLTECLGIKRLIAVAGSSMGGVESFQWAVSFPDFMEAVIPGTPMARANRQGNFIWEAVRQVVMVDPKWQGGNYPNDDPPRAGIGVGLQIQSVVGATAAGYEEEFATREQVHAAFAEDAKRVGETVQARDWVYRSWAIQSHDISQTRNFKGDLAAAARSIRARVLILPNCQDQLHTPREGGVLEAAQHIPHAKLVDLNDTGGHRGSRSARSLATFDTEVKDLLKRVAEGRPGISGPRFPKNWSRNDYCPG
jgi:homoserine O-acetyltransferase/O-succinyltransferase